MLLLLTGFLLIIASLHISNRDNFSHCSHSTGIYYNSTYPLSSPRIEADGQISYRIAIIADLDTNSKAPDGTWFSHYRKGWLTLNKERNKVSVQWDKTEVILSSDLSHKGRGMELSELVVFNGKLYTCDDRTGVVYEITTDNKVIPFMLLSDGDGKQTKGFKCEWMTVKDQHLWVGGLGKEWTTTKGVVQNLYPQWVKSIGPNGGVEHHNWVEPYNMLRKKGGFESPGYLIHEAAMWSEVHGQWFFLPRRASTEVYTEEDDERRATNILFRCDEFFRSIRMEQLGQKHHTRGFSSFKFIPNSGDGLIVALKSEEDQGRITSYIVAFDLNNHGKTLMAETKIGDVKFEGIEFI